MDNTMVKERKVQQTAFARVALKKACYDRFWQAAKREGKTLAGFLDDLSVSVAGSDTGEMVPETPQQQVMSRMAGFEGKLEEMGRELYGLIMALQKIPERQMPLLDETMIVNALKEDPGVKRVGWYDLQGDGTWVFNKARFEAWLKKDNARKDREYKARRITDLKAIENEKKGVSHEK